MIKDFLAESIYVSSFSPCFVSVGLQACGWGRISAGGAPLLIKPVFASELDRAIFFVEG